MKYFKKTALHADGSMTHIVTMLSCVQTRILHIMLILRVKYPVCRGHYYIYCYSFHCKLSCVQVTVLRLLTTRSHLRSVILMVGCFVCSFFTGIVIVSFSLLNNKFCRHWHSSSVFCIKVCYRYRSTHTPCSVP